MEKRIWAGAEESESDESSAGMVEKDFDEGREETAEKVERVVRGALERLYRVSMADSIGGLRGAGS